jgi:hypothetical protein
MERALLRLGVPPTYVTYRAEYIPTVTGWMVLCMVAVLPHPSLPRFKGEVCYSTALTVATALDVACRQALGCLLAQYRASFESGTLRLLPRDYWHLAPFVDGVPSHEGIQDDVDAAPFCESDETLVETASYLVDLDKYAHHLEDESRTLFGQIRDATVDARQYQPRCVQLERERERTAPYATVFACSSRGSTVRPLSCCSPRERGWTPVRRCCTSGRTFGG